MYLSVGLQFAFFFLSLFQGLFVSLSLSVCPLCLSLSLNLSFSLPPPFPLPLALCLLPYLPQYYSKSYFYVQLNQMMKLKGLNQLPFNWKMVLQLTCNPRPRQPVSCLMFTFVSLSIRCTSCSFISSVLLLVCKTTWACIVQGLSISEVGCGKGAHVCLMFLWD